MKVITALFSRLSDKFRFEAHIVFISWVFQREKMWAWFVNYDKWSGEEGSEANLICTVFHIGKLFQEILSSFLKCLGHPSERTHYHKHNIFIVTNDEGFNPRSGSINHSSQKQNKTLKSFDTIETELQMTTNHSFFQNRIKS